MAKSTCPHCSHAPGVGISANESDEDLCYLCPACGRAWNPWPEGYAYFHRAQELAYFANFARGLVGYTTPEAEDLARFSEIIGRDALHGPPRSGGVTMRQSEADRRWLITFTMRLLRERDGDTGWGSAWNELRGYIQEAHNTDDRLLPSDLLDYMGELRSNVLEPVREKLRLGHR